MSHVVTSGPAEVRHTSDRSSSVGMSLITILAVVAVVAALAWYLFTGPLANINRGSAVGTTTNVAGNPAALQEQPPVPAPSAASAQSSQVFCAPADCHLPPMEIDNSAAMGTSYVTPVELDLAFATPVPSNEELGRVMEGLVRGGGVGLVRSDGVRVVVQYDTAVVEPTAIRQRLAALGHPAKPGTEVKDAGDAAD